MKTLLEYLKFHFLLTEDDSALKVAFRGLAASRPVADKKNNSVIANDSIPPGKLEAPVLQSKK